MKKAKKVVALALCAVMLVVGSVAGTMAYMTSTTAVANNTFSVGNVKITLDEAPVDDYGAVVAGDRVTANSYKLIPGHSYVKDPVVHVDKASENCWLFVKVTNEIAAIEDATTIADQMTTLGWTKVNGETDVYAYNAIVNADDANGTDVKVFETFKVKGDAAVASYAGKSIKVQAYAVQADGFTTSNDAWTNAKASWGF